MQFEFNRHTSILAVVVILVSYVLFTERYIFEYVVKIGSVLCAGIALVLFTRSLDGNTIALPSIDFKFYAQGLSKALSIGTVFLTSLLLFLNGIILWNFGRNDLIAATGFLLGLLSLFLASIVLAIALVFTGWALFPQTKGVGK